MKVSIWIDYPDNTGETKIEEVEMPELPLIGDEVDIDEYEYRVTWRGYNIEGTEFKGASLHVVAPWQWAVAGRSYDHLKG